MQKKSKVQIVIRNSKLRLIDAYFKDKENDTKEVHMIVASILEELS